MISLIQKRTSPFEQGNNRGKSQDQDTDWLVLNKPSWKAISTVLKSLQKTIILLFFGLLPVGDADSNAIIYK